MVKILFIAIALALFTQPVWADSRESAYDRVMRTGTLHCGYSPWPPYFIMDPNTKALSGVSKDLSDSAAKILGLKIEYIEVSLGEQVQDLKSGKVDAVCGDAPWVISTIKYLDYSKPYYYLPCNAYGRIDEKRFSVPQDLNKSDVTFTAIDGDISTDMATTEFPKAKLNSLGNLTDPSQMLLNIVAKKADVVIDDVVSMSIFIKSNPHQIKPLFTHPLFVLGAGFSVKKGEIELLNMLNGGTDALINTGQAEHILKKYDPDGTLFLPAATPYRSK